MADVTLAEINGQYWLVRGDRYVDAVLADALPAGVSVEVVPCATRAEAWAMWETDDADPRDMPWMINPLLARRMCGGANEATIRFTAWSAMLSDVAQAELAAAADWLRAEPAGRLTLRQFCPADPPAGLADLQRLRGQLVGAAIVGKEAGAPRIDGVTETSAETEDTERLDIIRVAAPTGNAS